MESFGIGLLIAFVCVGVHYEGLSLATALIRRASKAHRMRVVIGLIAALFAHIVEVLVFAVGWMLLESSGLATLANAEQTFVDAFYFSFTTYSSLGYGDIVPVGDARLVAGLEALLGLVLISWTASFTYFEMTLYWDEGERPRDDVRRGLAPRVDARKAPREDPGA